MGAFGDGKQKKQGKVAPVSAGRVGKGGDAPFRGYINVNLSDEQKAAFDGWAESGSYWEALDGYPAEGIHLSLRYEEKGNCFLASATQRDVGSVNAGLVVTARASVPSRALARLLFCLALLSHAERWEDTQPVADPDRW